VSDLLRDALGEVRLQSFPNRQRLDEAGLLGRVRSSSYVPREGPEYDRLLRALHDLFEAHAVAGELDIVYRTDVFTVEKA
jgi:hypothetical protein